MACTHLGLEGWDIERLKEMKEIFMYACLPLSSDENRALLCEEKGTSSGYRRNEGWAAEDIVNKTGRSNNRAIHLPSIYNQCWISMTIRPLL